MSKFDTIGVGDGGYFTIDKCAISICCCSASWWTGNYSNYFFTQRFTSCLVCGCIEYRTLGLSFVRQKTSQVRICDYWSSLVKVPIFPDVIPCRFLHIGTKIGGTQTTSTLFCVTYYTVKTAGDNRPWKEGISFIWVFLSCRSLDSRHIQCSGAKWSRERKSCIT